VDTILGMAGSDSLLICHTVIPSGPGQFPRESGRLKLSDSRTHTLLGPVQVCAMQEAVPLGRTLSVEPDDVIFVGRIMETEKVRVSTTLDTE
jgi:hypothetical protein